MSEVDDLRQKVQQLEARLEKLEPSPFPPKPPSPSWWPERPPWVPAAARWTGTVWVNPETGQPCPDPNAPTTEQRDRQKEELWDQQEARREAGTQVDDHGNPLPEGYRRDANGQLRRIGQHGLQPLFPEDVQYLELYAERCRGEKVDQAAMRLLEGRAINRSAMRTGD